MINRDDICLIIGTAANPDRPSLLTGDAALRALEDAGYRIVPEGLVPKFDDLDEVSEVLSKLSGWTNGQHNAVRAKDSATLIRQIRDLALLVLRIDPAAIGPAGD